MHNSSMRIQLGLEYYMKGKVFAFKSVWNEFDIVWELPHTLILPLYKTIKCTFSKAGVHTQDLLENSESKREIVTKHP